LGGDGRLGDGRRGHRATPEVELTVGAPETQYLARFQVGQIVEIQPKVKSLVKIGSFEMICAQAAHARDAGLQIIQLGADPTQLLVARQQASVVGLDCQNVLCTHVGSQGHTLNVLRTMCPKPKTPPRRRKVLNENHGPQTPQSHS
jgi:hypothetical protein